MPILGICYGSQLMMHMLGGKVTRAPERANLTVIAAVCAGLGCTPSDLIEVRIVEERAVATEQTRTSLGDLRPVPARIHRQPQSPPDQ